MYRCVFVYIPLRVCIYVDIIEMEQQIIAEKTLFFSDSISGQNQKFRPVFICTLDKGDGLSPEMGGVRVNLSSDMRTCYILKS